MALQKQPLVTKEKLITSITASELQEFIALDPYMIEKVADYEIIHFNIIVVATGLENLKRQ
jgi:hypothetical protein